MKTFEEILVTSESRTGLDMGFPFYEDPIQEVSNDIREANIDYRGEVPSISIFELKNILNRFIEKGATRIYIKEHEGHVGYYFNGVRLEEKKD